VIVKVLSRNYVPVIFPVGDKLVNTEIAVRITGAERECLRGDFAANLLPKLKND